MARRVVWLIVVGCLSACGTSSEGSGTSAPTASDDGTAMDGVADPMVDSTIAVPPELRDLVDAQVATYECFAAHGVDAQDPTRLSPAQTMPVPSYPPEVAAEAWDACRGNYLETLRLGMRASSFGADAELADEAVPLAFADCMVTLGWMPLGASVVEDVDGYTQANADCRTPREGESAEESYCRFVQAIQDRATHDRSMSVTGIPIMGTNDVRRRAAVALYDEALQLAPEELLDDLHTLQDGFRDGTPIPEAVGESVWNYHLSVCGAFVYLGSMD